MNLELIKSYLRIDYEEDDMLLQNILETSELFLEGAITNWNLIKKNKNYQSKVKILQLAVIQNLYDNRGLNVKEPEINHIIESLILQLDLEGVTYESN